MILFYHSKIYYLCNIVFGMASSEVGMLAMLITHTIC